MQECVLEDAPAASRDRSGTSLPQTFSMADVDSEVMLDISKCELWEGLSSNVISAIDDASSALNSIPGRFSEHVSEDLSDDAPPRPIPQCDQDHMDLHADGAAAVDACKLTTVSVVTEAAAVAASLSVSVSERQGPDSSPAASEGRCGEESTSGSRMRFIPSAGDVLAQVEGRARARAN